LRKTSTDGALDTGLGLHGVDVAAEQAVMAPTCLSGMFSGAERTYPGIAKTALMTLNDHS
jgi:hypothetical protein